MSRWLRLVAHRWDPRFMYYRFLTGLSIFIALLRGESFLQNDHISHFAVPSYFHAKTLLSAGSSSGLATTFHAYVFPPQGQHILKCHTFPYLLGPQETGLFETGLFLSLLSHFFSPSTLVAASASPCSHVAPAEYPSVNRPIPPPQSGIWELTGNSIPKEQTFPILGKPRCPVTARSR